MNFRLTVLFDQDAGDRLRPFIAEFIADEGLADSEAQRDALEAAIRAAFAAARAAEAALAMGGAFISTPLLHFIRNYL